MDILKQIQTKLVPDKKEQKRIETAISKLKNKLQPHLKDADIFIGGSVAKGTECSGKNDIDVFIRFKYDKYAKKSDEISSILKRALEKSGIKYTTLHGSRNYYSTKINKFEIELIPILNIKSSNQAKNITDVSPLHVNWVKKNITPKLRNHARLAKEFCRANRLYGAESYIQGFSGYVLEILIIHFKGFIPLLKKASKFKDKVIIDPEHHYKTKENILKNINSSKLASPLILIDPTDKTRNTSAALSKEQYLHFKQKAKEFLKKPSEKFFIRKHITPDNLKKRYKKLILIKVAVPKGKPDVVGAKLRTAYRKIKKSLKEFDLKKHGWDWDKNKNAFFWYSPEKTTLPRYEERIGPPGNMKNAVTEFRKKHKNPFTRKGRIYSKVRRKHCTIKSVLQNTLKEIELKVTRKELQIKK